MGFAARLHLIKGLRHTAWRSYPDMAKDLTAITGQNFGTTFAPWHDWWMKQNPGNSFDFDSHLGPLVQIQPTTQH